MSKAKNIWTWEMQMKSKLFKGPFILKFRKHKRWIYSLNQWQSDKFSNRLIYLEVMMKMQMHTKSLVYSTVSVCFFDDLKDLKLNSLDIFSLVIFIGGVAFSISHAIIPTEEAEHIKHLAEVNSMENNSFSFGIFLLI